MEKTLKIFAWFQVILGGLAILSFPIRDYDALTGGVLFLTGGILALSYIRQVKDAPRKYKNLSKE